MTTESRSELPGPDESTEDLPDSRPARREAIEAASLWAAALVVTVGLSTWLGRGQVGSVLGVPHWALFGVFAPWILFFGLHLWFCRERSHGREVSRR